MIRGAKDRVGLLLWALTAAVILWRLAKLEGRVESAFPPGERTPLEPPLMPLVTDPTVAATIAPLAVPSAPFPASGMTPVSTGFMAPAAAGAATGVAAGAAMGAWGATAPRPPSVPGEPPPAEGVLTSVPPGKKVRGKHYGLKVGAIAAAGTLVLLVGGWLAASSLLGLRISGKPAKKVSQGDALADFRKNKGTGGDVAGETVTTDTTTTTAASSAAAGGTGTTPKTTKKGSTTTKPATGGPATLKPPQGVYTFAGSGFEQVSIFGGQRRNVPATVYGTVEHRANNCWWMRLSIFAEHTEESTYCAAQPGALNSLTSVTAQSFFNQAVTATSTCSAQDFAWPGMQPGQSKQVSCKVQNSGADTNSQTGTGPMTYVGAENVNVGGQTVATFHMRNTQTISGGQSGTSTYEFWIAQSNGMFVRLDRNINVTGKTLIGDNKYTEQTRFVLKSMTPQT